MKHLLKYIGFAVFSLHASSSFAASTSNNQPDGRYCLVCHGGAAQGSEVIGGPNLSVLPDWYLKAQLEGFQHGWRSKNSEDSYSSEMQMIANSMNKQDIDMAIRFIKNLPAKQAQPMLSGNKEHGKQLYQACAACHGQQAEGNASLKAPPLLGQNDWYLHKQLISFKQGNRGAVKEDISGQLMRQSAALLTTEQDILDVISYINSLNTINL
ncbi:MAG: c-type cytochrome [Paraglaciecola sp.]|nr:c-type cytochrome [Paraglaciecola sp.]